MKKYWIRSLMAVSVTFGLLTGIPAAQAGADNDPYDALEAQAQELSSPHKPHHPTFKSSVQLSEEQVNMAHKAAREAYEQAMRDKLGSLAKVSPAEAKRAAEHASPGYTVHHVILRPVQQNLVYVVFLTHKEKGRLITVVDAGNGKVLEKHELKASPQHQKRMTEKRVQVNG
jgi:hypothetical protein